MPFFQNIKNTIIISGDSSADPQSHTNRSNVGSRYVPNSAGGSCRVQTSGDENTSNSSGKRTDSRGHEQRSASTAQDQASKGSSHDTTATRSNPGSTQGTSVIEVLSDGEEEAALRNKTHPKKQFKLFYFNGSPGTMREKVFDYSNTIYSIPFEIEVDQIRYEKYDDRYSAEIYLFREPGYKGRFRRFVLRDRAGPVPIDSFYRSAQLKFVQPQPLLDYESDQEDEQRAG